jgi:putative membrane protein insertion efficiency factor
MRNVRRALWLAGGPVRAVLVVGIRLYAVTLSGWLGGQCRFTPSCSAYAETAIRTCGATRGTALAVWRVLRCNPFGETGTDPVPPSPRYDALIPTRNAGT